MVLTFTLGAGLSAGDEAVNTRTMLVAIVGCNIAWGVIDGVMYIMGSLFERGSQARIVRALRQASDEKQAISVIRQHLDPTLSPILDEDERIAFYHRLLDRLQQMPPQRTRIEKEDIYGAIASFWLVLLATIPAILPFIWIQEFHAALRISNCLSLALLFIVGYTWAKYTNTNRWIAGFSLLLLGLVLVAVAIALGG
ncbi:VIT1/CCC1 transporter family protein [Leptolyngbya ohadii]|uniref:VIT1/CCC1 transporter family protein n=1 Tax=Leptolyngbya ohadii TaxID=1962290 RepID=UPI000B59E31F|nr:VIT1/CCC1 transporter family protein [Leptolyngbya ohadii]